MSSPKCHGLGAGLFVALCLAGNRAAADEARSAGSTNQPMMRTQIRREEVVGATNAKPIQRAFLNVGTNRFAFIVPEDFKLDASNPSKIILTSPDYNCFISVQLDGLLTREPAGQVTDAFRNRALDEFPEGAIIRDYELRAANHSGPAFELRWKNSSGSSQFACVGFVPSGAGVLKFSLLSGTDKYPKNQLNFQCLLRSFQSNEGGKLDIIPVPGNS